MINGDLRGRARLVLTQLGEQVQEARDSGELGDDGGETFTPAPRADTPVSSAARSGRGGGARDYGEGPRDGHEATSCRARRGAGEGAGCADAIARRGVGDESGKRTPRGREWQERQAAFDREERKQTAAARAEEAKEAAKRGRSSCSSLSASCVVELFVYNSSPVLYVVVQVWPLRFLPKRVDVLMEGGGINLKGVGDLIAVHAGVAVGQELGVQIRRGGVGPRQVLLLREVDVRPWTDDMPKMC